MKKVFSLLALAAVTTSAMAINFSGVDVRTTISSGIEFFSGNTVLPGVTVNYDTADAFTARVAAVDDKSVNRPLVQKVFGPASSVRGLNVQADAHVQLFDFMGAQGYLGVLGSTSQVNGEKVYTYHHGPENPRVTVDLNNDWVEVKNLFVGPSALFAFEADNMFKPYVQVSAGLAWAKSEQHHSYAYWYEDENNKPPYTAWTKRLDSLYSDYNAAADDYGQAKRGYYVYGAVGADVFENVTLKAFVAYSAYPQTTYKTELKDFPVKSLGATNNKGTIKYNVDFKRSGVTYGVTAGIKF